MKLYKSSQRVVQSETTSNQVRNVDAGNGSECGKCNEDMSQKRGGGGEGGVQVGRPRGEQPKKCRMSEPFSFHVAMKTQKIEIYKKKKTSRVIV